MKKFIITEEQLKRIGTTNILLMREISRNTLYQEVDDSVALITHLDNVAKQLIAEPIPNYELPVTGGKFVWVPNKE